MEILVAPFSNNALRDWPIGHYRDAVGLLLERLPPEGHITVIGTRAHRAAAATIVRPYHPERVSNACGMAWTEVLRKVRAAACVIGNNSGITHASSYFGTPTVCVFGGSHQRTEWGPLHPNAIIVSRVIGCSPCQFNHIRDCPYDAACLREITPLEVANTAFRLIQRTARTPQASFEDKGRVPRSTNKEAVATC